jgi:hypothetical protein
MTDELTPEQIERQQIAHELRLERQKEEIQNLHELTKQRQKMVRLGIEEGESLDKINAAKVKALEAQKAELDYKERIGTLSVQEERQQKKLIKRIQKLTKETQEYTKAQEKLKQEMAEGDRVAKNYGQALFGLSGEFDSLYTKYVPKTTGEIIGMTKSIVLSIVTLSAFRKATLKIINSSVNLAFAQDKASSAFRQATGAGNEFNTTLYDIERAGAGAGVTMDEAGQATLSLFNNYRDFTNLNEAEAKRIGTTVALMNELGVSTETSSKIMDQATKSLRMTSGEAEETLRTLASTAKQIGKPMSEVAEDFASVAPKLAFYGTQMMGVFQKLEQQSKSTGMSVDELMGIVGDPFDTFEGAGQKVGRLNAILGGPYLNSIDMLNATEAERLELMKQSIEAAGVSIDMMSKQEQQALANAAGMSVDQLRRSMGALSDEEEKEAMQQERLAELAAETKSVFDELKNALRTLIVENRAWFTSFAEGISKFSKWIKELDKGTVKAVFFTTILIGVTSKLYLLIKGMMIAKSLWTASGLSLKMFSGALKLFTATQKSASIAMWAFNIASKAAWGPYALVGVVLALVVGHIINMRKQGLSWTEVLVDMTQKVLVFLGPMGMFISFFISFFKHVKDGKGFVDALKESLLDLANNLSFGLIGRAMNLLSGKGWSGGGFTNAERMKARKTNDVIVTSSGEVIEPSADDTIMAGKAGGPLSKAFGGLGAAAASGPMGMIMQGALRQVLGPLLREAITDPVVAALRGGPGTGGAGQQKQDINIVVKIGEKELNDQIITAINSPQGAMAISPFYQG